MADSREIAARLQQAEDAGEQALGEFLTEKVELRHVPAMDMDGFFDREPLVAGMIAERELAKKLMADFVSTTTYTARGDGEVVSTMQSSGRLPDGSVLALSTEQVYTVADGQITGMTTYVDTDNVARLIAVQESGVELPG
jgi:ketosteroid isomerase-like protein